MPTIIEASMVRKPQIEILGTDFSTPDGRAMRSRSCFRSRIGPFAGCIHSDVIAEQFVGARGLLHDQTDPALG